MMGQKFQPGDHQDGVTRRIAGGQFVVANLNRRRAFFQDRLSLREVFHPIRIRTKIKKVRSLEVDAKNGTVVKEKRQNKAKNTCRDAARTLDGSSCKG